MMRSVVRIDPPVADEIVHSGSDGFGLLNDHEMPGVRDIDDVHPLAQLLAQCMAIPRRGDDVIKTFVVASSERCRPTRSRRPCRTL